MLVWERGSQPRRSQDEKSGADKLYVVCIIFDCASLVAVFVKFKIVELLYLLFVLSLL